MNRETLNVIPSRDGKPYYVDTCGQYWRSYRFITGATSYERVRGPEDFYQSAVAFKRAVQEDLCGRAQDVQEEIDFVLERADLAHRLLDMQKKGICVIDLDTVMPGLSVNDFGDSIRFGASTALEDERDLTKVALDLSLYEAYVKGYIEGCGGKLTEKEIEMLPLPNAV